MMADQITINFLGAAGTVTGSKYLVCYQDKKLLIDCGLFQGAKEIRKLNWEYLPVAPQQIDAVLLTHGHLDHTGFLPRLVHMGFNKAIYGTIPTHDIAEIILLDSAKIQEEETKRANLEGYSSHKPAKPLYTLADVERTLPLFSCAPEGEWVQPFTDIRFRFQYNGHIVGACFIELEIAGKRLVFSGDIGREQDLLMYPPKKPQRADVLVMESTYGDRVHLSEDTVKRLQEIITDCQAKGGTLIIPSFAVERTQLLMYIIWQLKIKEEIPDIPVYMDSPMGANVTRVFHRSEAWHKLTKEACTQMCQSIQTIRSYKDTLRTIDDPQSKIVIAGSGMVTGGRVLNYLQRYLSDPSTTVLLAGYQAQGTNGRLLLEGASMLKIYGNSYRVNAKIESLQSLSAHADQKELLRWLKDIEGVPEKIFVVHGEAEPGGALRDQIKDIYGWDCEIPRLYDTVQIQEALSIKP